MLLIFPPENITKCDNDFSLALYCIYFTIVPIIMIIYIVYHGIKDIRK